MSAEPLHPPPVDDPEDQLMVDALLVLYRLPDEALASIQEARKALGISFAEAALHTGLATQSELKEAEEWIRRKDLNGGRSIVEEALRRRPASPQRDLVVWQGERLSPGPSLIIAHDPYSQRSELIRSLRTELLMRTSARRGAAIFTILSPESAEGRSQLSAELAIAFAQLGSRTLLVDADMRHPGQHTLFGADNLIGLAQALSDGSAVRLHGIDGVVQMDLLTCGAPPPNPLELLSGPRFERMVADWRRSYEFVVIDTPPAARYSDALPVASVAGNVLMVGRANSTSFNALTELRRRVDTTNARILGSVLNTF
jgi:protein-tyrosine kinase